MARPGGILGGAGPDVARRPEPGIARKRHRLSILSPETMTPRPRFTRRDFGLYAAVIIAWGFSWIAMHCQVGVVAPEISVFWRFLLAAPMMFGFAAVRKERLLFSPGDHVAFLCLGIALFCTNFALFYYAAQWITSGLLAVVFSLASVMNVWMGALILGAPIDRRVMVGGTLGFLGVALLFYPQLARTRLDPHVLIGLGLCVGGTLSFSIGNMISARLQRRKIPVVAASAWGMLYGTVVLGIYAVIRNQPFRIDPRLPYLAGLLYLALMASVVAFACYLTLLGRIGVDRAAYVTVMLPLVALVVSTIVEGYRWTIPAGCGLAAVLTGNLLVLRTPGRR